MTRVVSVDALEGAKRRNGSKFIPGTKGPLSMQVPIGVFFGGFWRALWLV